MKKIKLNEIGFILLNIDKTTTRGSHEPVLIIWEREFIVLLHMLDIDVAGS
jgi:hypothetical protein